MLLTKSTTFIIGPIAIVLGYIMEGIFNLLNKIGLPNIGLSIILFTIVTNICLLPMTIKQQKFSKLQQKMQPELKALEDKYKGKKDQQSTAAKSMEMQEIYKKYGVSPMGSCVQLLIQMPILFSLYQIIYRVPAYVPKVKAVYDSIVEQIIKAPESIKLIEGFKNFNQFKKNFDSAEFDASLTVLKNNPVGNWINADLVNSANTVKNSFIDVLNNAPKTDWESLKTALPESVSTIERTLTQLSQYNNFLGLDIANSPLYMIQTGWADKNFGIIIAAAIIPILSALTQWLNIKLMPQQAQTGEQNAMTGSLKTMNNVMPIMSMFFCFTFPTGLGLYWVAGAVVRSIIQVVVNKNLDNMDMEKILEKAAVKNEKKAKKGGTYTERMAAIAAQNTRNTNTQKTNKYGVITDTKTQKTQLTQIEKELALKNATDYYNSDSGNMGTIASRANMVKKYNEQSKKD